MNYSNTMNIYIYNDILNKFIYILKFEFVYFPSQYYYIIHILIDTTLVYIVYLV